MTSTSLQPTVGGRRRVFCCHRATLSGRFPPNSLAAVQECVAAGAPRLEIDVRFLADDAMLVFHDQQLDFETTGAGRVDVLDSAAARALRLREHPETGLCFLEDVVEAMAGSRTLLQVDLKLMRPLSAARAERLCRALLPLGDGVLTGSQAHWNLRQLGPSSLRLAFDPTLQWHFDPRRRAGDGLEPARQGVHGLWDDAPLAHLRHASARDYVDARINDLVGLLPGAVEWMVDFQTILHFASLGIALGDELARRGIELAAWTVPDEGPGPSGALLRRLFGLGTATVITDYAPALAGYAAALT